LKERGEEGREEKQDAIVLIFHTGTSLSLFKHYQERKGSSEIGLCVSVKLNGKCEQLCIAI